MLGRTGPFDFYVANMASQSQLDIDAEIRRCYQLAQEEDSDTLKEHLKDNRYLIDLIDSRGE